MSSCRLATTIKFTENLRRKFSGYLHQSQEQNISYSTSVGASCRLVMVGRKIIHFLSMIFTSGSLTPLLPFLKGECAGLWGQRQEGFHVLLFFENHILICFSLAIYWPKSLFPLHRHFRALPLKKGEVELVILDLIPTTQKSHNFFRPWLSAARPYGRLTVEIN